MFVIDVAGTPGPQGSKKGFAIARKDKVTGQKVYTGKVAMVESSKKVKPWREAVVEAVKKVVTEPIDGAVNVAIVFYVPRPKKHYRTGRFAHLLRDDAPLYPTTNPDVDKLVRATLDALTMARAYKDDSVVVDQHGSKRYADHRVPGARIQLVAKQADSRKLVTV